MVTLELQARIYANHIHTMLTQQSASLHASHRTAQTHIMSSAQAQQQPKTGSPNDFLKGVIGKNVNVCLNSGIDYRGVLSCLDGYMNIALEQAVEYVDGVQKNSYGDAFIRGNNGVYKALDHKVSLKLDYMLITQLFSSSTSRSAVVTNLVLIRVTPNRTCKLKPRYPLPYRLLVTGHSPPTRCCRAAHLQSTDPLPRIAGLPLSWSTASSCSSAISCRQLDRSTAFLLRPSHRTDCRLPPATCTLSLSRPSTIQ